MTSQIQTSTVRRVPWFVTAFGAVCAALGISLAVIFGFGVNKAFAFTDNGLTYPDTLVDVTVTLSDTLMPPPDSICGWHTVQCSPIYGSAATPTVNDAGVSTDLFFENANTVTSGNPWFIYFNCGQSMTGVSSGPNNYPYWSRFAYDSYAGWWGLNPAVLAPTVTFQSGSLLTNQTFIKWLVDNSDYRTRYNAQAWTTPTVVTVMNGIAWNVPSANPQFILTIQHNATSSLNSGWETLETYSPGAYSGSYICPQTGYYRLIFTYTINGTTSTWTYDSSLITITVPTEVSFGTWSINQIDSVNVCIVATVYMADSVKLQYRTSPTAQWQDANVSFFNPDNNATADYRSTPFMPITGWEYQMVATGNGKTVTQYVGTVTNPTSVGSDTWSDLWNDAWNTISPIIEAFKAIFGSIFSWLPSELAGFLLAIILVFIVLGVVGRIIG